MNQQDDYVIGARPGQKWPRSRARETGGDGELNFCHLALERDGMVSQVARGLYHVREKRGREGLRLIGKCIQGIFPKYFSSRITSHRAQGIIPQPGTNELLKQS